MSYTKLFSSILDSTIWQEDLHVKIVWITLLAMTDRDGVVEASLPGLARRANVTIPQAEQAIERLSAPDAYSRTKEHEGRRIAVLDEGGGWQLLNYEKYREKLDADDQRAKAAARQQRRRDRVKRDGHAESHSVTPNRDDVTPERDEVASGHGPSRVVRHAEAKASTEAETLSLVSGSSPSGLPGSGAEDRAEHDQVPPPDEPPPGMALEMPRGWKPAPEPELERKAAELGIDLAAELLKLSGRSEQQADWQARWRTWLGHAISFARKQAKPSPTPNPDRETRAAADRRAAIERDREEHARRAAAAHRDRAEVEQLAAAAQAQLRGAG